MSLFQKMSCICFHEYKYLGIDFYSHGYFELFSARQRTASLKVLMSALRKEVVVGVACETQIPSIQGFHASNFYIWHQNLTTRLEKLSLEGFQEDAYDVSCQSVFFNNLSYFVGETWRTFHTTTHSQAYYRLSTTTRPPIHLLVSLYSILTFQTLGQTWIKHLA